MSTKPIIKVGVQTLVIKDGSILLGRRKNCFGAGTWGLPGGHLEIGETLPQAAIRELKEETSINALEVRVVCVTDPNPKTNHHMQVGVLVQSYSGVPVIMEPHNCDALRFFPLGELPSELFPASSCVIRNYLQHVFYSPLDEHA